MLAASLIAIPAYLLLFVLAIPYDADKGKTIGLVVITPSLLFLLAAFAFAASFLRMRPKPISTFPEKADIALRRAVTEHSRLTLLGALSAAVGCVWGVAVVVKGHL
ncbi:MAG: hypothetical protein ICV77_01955 [Cyanobacteria bacterium Co-bin8]|nr:hypothetical protein [Cyanobacteria bacterium Co-bin8]